jgi:hypothetical protein
MTINPPDALVAARSFPRRWRALFASAVGDEGATDILERSGAEQLAGQAADVLEATAERVRPGFPSTGGTGDVLDRIDAASEHLAKGMDAVADDDWRGQNIDTLSSGIDRVASLLRQAQKAIEEARFRR